MNKKIVYEYVWSLMDRLLIVLALITILFAFSSIALCSIVVFVLLLFIRRYIFSPTSIFIRLRDTVSNTIIDQSKLKGWNKWENIKVINSKQDLYEQATEMLDSIGDFYTCLLSPHLASTKMKGNKLSDYGLSFGVKRISAGLLVLDKDKNLLPEQDNNHNPQIHSIIYNSPSYKAGLRPGDIVLTIDNSATTNCSLGQLYGLSRNAKIITFNVLRNNTPITPVMSLKQKTIPTITWEIHNNHIGYLRLETFEHISISELKDALHHLRKTSAYIVDLRGNRGGDIRNALILLSAFIKEGILAQCTRRNENGEKINLRYSLMKDSIVIEAEDSNGFSIISSPRITRIPCTNQVNKPIIVLVDSYSMSGSELFAGAMQDTGCARILGTTTFGKGVGQDVFSIPPYTRVSISSMKFKTPSGQWPGDGGISICNGIKPDINLEPTDGTIIGGPDDKWLLKAVELLEHS